MKKLHESILQCEEKADTLAAEMGVRSYYPDSTAEFGGVSVMCFERKPDGRIFRQVGVLEKAEGGPDAQLNRLYQLNVDSREEVMTEHSAQKLVGRTDVLISVQHYNWLSIKHRLTLSQAADLCGYRLTGDRVTDDRMITMQMGSRKFRIVTYLTGRTQKAVEWYKALHRLPTLPPFTSNRYAGVPEEDRFVNFFFTPQGDCYCKAPAYSSYPYQEVTEEAFFEVYNSQNGGEQ